MRRFPYFFLWMLLLGGAGELRAQLSVVVQMDPLPSPYISDWRSRPNTVRFVCTNPTGANVNVRFDAFIEGDRRGRVAETKLDAAIPPVVLPPGTTILNAIDARLLEEGAVRYIGPTRTETERSGRLPEDRYRLCVRLRAYDAPNDPLSPEMCSAFTIQLIQPPSLTAPPDTSHILTPPTFQWTAVQMGIGSFARYEIIVIELDPGQTNPGVAMNTNIPLIQRTANLPVYQYLPSDPPLEKGKRYAWQVRAYDPDDHYTFANKGLSQIWTFTYAPYVPPGISVDQQTPKTTKVTKAKTTFLDKGFGFVPGFDFSLIIKNTTINGQLQYGFNKSDLLHEHTIGIRQQVQLGLGARDLKPLPYVTVRLVRRFKTIPDMMYCGPSIYDVTHGKSINTAEKIMGVTTTDGNGNFSFNFIESDSTVIIRNVALRCGGGEFVDYKENATLYKYYNVEVVNPYFCSSRSEIAAEPGQTVDVSLSSLVRTWKLDVTINDYSKGEPLYNLVNVYISRPSKGSIPFTVPAEEGDLETPVAGIGQVKMQPINVDQPTRKFTNTKLGYVISMKETKATPKGHAVFTRLVRNAGGSDGYYISARTPIEKPDGNFNELFYLDNNKAKWVQKIKTNEEGFDVGYSFSNEIVYNRDFVAPTVTSTIKLAPRFPRVFGQVKRSDSKKDLENVVVRFEIKKYNSSANPGIVDGQYYDVTDKNGQYEVYVLKATDPNWTYNVRFLKYGFLTAEKEMAITFGRQYFLGVTELDPKLMVTRGVIDEQAQPLAGVKGILGDGAEHITDAKGTFVSPAIPGWQPFHLEKRPEYADKDTNVVIQDNYWELFGKLLVDPIVMFKALRRLEVRVLGPDFAPIKGAEVVLEDKYPPSSGVKYPYQLGYIYSGTSEWKKTTNAQGIVSFAYKSSEATATVRIHVPNTDYISAKRTYYGIAEGGKWTKRIAVLQAGGRVKGVVHLGKRPEMGKVKMKGKFVMIDPNLFSERLPVKGARVFVEGYDDLVTFTNDQGEYDLRGVPPGLRVIKAAKSANSVEEQSIGDQYPVTVAALKEHNVNLYLTKYNNMDITKLMGFPIEIDQLAELGGGNIRVNGAFVEVPKNSVLGVKETDRRYEFNDVELTPLSGGAGTPLAKPVAGSVRVIDKNIPLLAYGGFPVDLEDESGVPVEPQGGDFTKGQFRGLCAVVMTPFGVNSNEFEAKDPDGNPSPLYLASYADPGPAQANAGWIQSQGGSFALGDGSVRIIRSNGSPAQFKLYKYNATANPATSYLKSTGLHLDATAHALITGCGATMSTTCDIPLAIGEVIIRKPGMDPLDPTKIPSQELALMKWKLAANSFGLNSGYFTFSGDIKAPLLKNLVNDSMSILIPFTNMELRPAQLTGGTFSFSELDLLGVATLKFTKPFVFSSDAQSWFVTSQDPEIPGSALEGLDPGTKFLFNNFYLRSDITNSFNTSSASFVVHKVSSLQMSTFQFGYGGSGPYLSMMGNLTLINIPDLAPLAARIYYLKGGKFGMDGIYFESPYPAGGVKLTIANGLLGPEGFHAEGNWGQYKNQIVLTGKFAFNMSFWHRKKGSGYSTIAEIINSDHAPPQQQSMFGNSSEPDVKNCYGRTQLEPGMVWTTNIAGWYQTSELAAKDSMYYTVEGSGGNGTVAIAKSTMKMKGTSGGLGMLLIDDRESFPKGPAAAAPPPADDGPFQGMTFTPDFNKMAIIGTMHIDKEISPGTGFKGDVTTVVSFGSKKFWSFLAAGTGQVADPPCQGTALFVAGLNYTLSPEDLQKVIDYSISKRPLPDEFKTMTGFFTQVAVVMPIPGTPNFDINIAVASLSVHCTMGGEARVGLNFANGTTFYLGVYATAKVKVDAKAEVSLFGLAGVKLEGHVLVEAGAGGFFTYNSEAGASFDITGFILGQLTMKGCVVVLGVESCFDATVFKVGGTINGRIGNNEYLDIQPTFEFLGI